MPKFDYKCNKCGTTREEGEPDLLVYFKHRKDGFPVDEDTGPHFICQGKFKRIYAFGGSILKGSGWYSKDNQ